MNLFDFSDQRNDESVVEKLREQRQQPITTAQGKKLAATIGALRYYECSAKDMTGMQEIFDEVVSILKTEKKSNTNQIHQRIFFVLSLDL
jgi:predicted GTPase